MFAALLRIDSVHKRHMLKLAIGCERYNILPPRVGRLIDTFRLAFRANIEVDVLLEMFHRDKGAIVLDFDGFVGDGGDIVDAFLEKRAHIWRQSLNAESRIIGAERYLRIWFCRCTLRDFRRANLVEVVLEFLDIF